MSELYIQKLITLLGRGIITVDDIKDIDYRTEIENRLNHGSA